MNKNRRNKIWKRSSRNLEEKNKLQRRRRK